MEGAASQRGVHRASYWPGVCVWLCVCVCVWLWRGCGCMCVCLCVCVPPLTLRAMAVCMVQAIFMGLVLGVVFFQLGVDDYQLTFGLLFFSAIFLSFANLSYVCLCTLTCWRAHHMLYVHAGRSLSHLKPSSSCTSKPKPDSTAPRPTLAACC